MARYCFGWYNSKWHNFGLHILSYYNPETFKLYVYNGGHQIYRISVTKITLVDNGTDGVLFMPNPKAQPFEIQKPDRSCSWLDKVMLAKLSSAKSVLTTDETKLAMQLWFYSIFFPQIMCTKVILLLLGVKGSGKTSRARRFGKLIFGDSFDVTPLTTGPPPDYVPQLIRESSMVVPAYS